MAAKAKQAQGEGEGEVFDVAIIGAGPGGYVAAIRAAQLGMRVLLIDKRGVPGGTCLNVGCIPSKALLHSSHLFRHAVAEFGSHGITAERLSFDLDRMLERKEGVVSGLVRGINFLLGKNKVVVRWGAASVVDSRHIEVIGEGGEVSRCEARAIILATGSESALLRGIAVDEERVVSSTGALSFLSVPEHLAVVGAGVIGLELGSVWLRLGSRVTILDVADRIGGGLDGGVSDSFRKILEQQGFVFSLSTRVSGLEVVGGGVRLQTIVGEQGEAGILDASHVLVSVGRVPCTEGLGLEGVGVSLDERGFVKVDSRGETSVGGIYAIGDCIGGMMLAHKAEEEGVAVIERLAGVGGHVDYGVIPSVIYTSPEVAFVGLGEEQARALGGKVSVGVFPMRANSRSRASGEVEGFVKVISEEGGGKILGAHIIAEGAGVLIQEYVAVMAYRGTTGDIAMICHPHPTTSEALREAALAAEGRAVHS